MISIHQYLGSVRLGLALAFITLLFGISMGILFGANEDGVKEWINTSVSAHPQLHDEKSGSKIWRYAQRAHFHATGVGAFTLGLVVLTAFSGMRRKLKSLSATLIGLGGLYPLAWLSMFLLAPSMGRDPAHHTFVTELLTYVGVGSLLAGMGLLAANLFLNFGDTKTPKSVAIPY